VLENGIRDLAKNKLSGYIAFLFYLLFLGAAFINAWLSFGFLCLAIITAIGAVFYEVKFTWKVLKNE